LANALRAIRASGFAWLKTRNLLTPL